MAARNPGLTAAGEVLIEHARAVLERLRRAENDLAETQALLLRQARRAAGVPDCVHRPRPPAIDRLQRRTPAIHATFSPSSHDSAVDAVLGRDADVAVVFHRPRPLRCDRPRPAPAHPPETTTRCSRSSPAATDWPKRKRISLKDLAAERWVVGTTRGPDSIIRRACQAAGVQPNVAIETDDLLVVQGVVAAGLAVSLSPALAVAHTRPDIVLRPLADAHLFR